MDKARLYVLPGMRETVWARVTLKGLMLKMAPWAWKLYFPVRGLTVERPVLADRPMPLMPQTLMSALSKPPLTMAWAGPGAGVGTGAGVDKEVAAGVELGLGGGVTEDEGAEDVGAGVEVAPVGEGAGPGA